MEEIQASSTTYKLDFNAFNNQDYLRALEAKNKAEDITRVL